MLLGGVEEVDSEVEGSTDGGNGVGFGNRPNTLPKGEAPKPQN